MNERAYRHAETAAAPPSTQRADRASASGQGAAGAEDYPFDPRLLIHEQTGLDRLRCISDREIAAVLYSLYMLQERKRVSAPAPRPSASTPRVGLRVLAMRALGGELGFAAEELATNLLVDESGRENITERTLRDFARAFRNLPRNR
jgi:hypothetical protein